MIHTVRSFNKNLHEFLELNYPEISFVPEPLTQEVKYPAVVVHYQSWKKFEKEQDLFAWEAQIDVIFKDHRTFECQKLSRDILRNYNLTIEKPGKQSRIRKIDYEQDPPTEITNSDIRIRLIQDLTPLPEPHRPEIRRISFVLLLIHKDDS